MQIKKRVFADIIPSASFQSQFQNINKISADDLPIYCYELINPSTNTTVVITSFGGTILSIRTPDRNGTVEEITLCFKSLNELNHPTVHPFYGALIGRYANRIAKGIFETDSGTHQLATNNGPNHLHGGRVGFDKKIWKEVSFTVDDGGATLELEHFSPHLEENYPGNLTARVKYELTSQNQLKIHYHATTDQETVVNMTNHTYWNLSGNTKRKVYDHHLHLAAAHYLPSDSTLIPTGEIKAVEGTPFDFHTNTKPLGESMVAIDGGGQPGIDHCFVLQHPSVAAENAAGEGELTPKYAAKVSDPISGRFVQVETTQPGIQVYTGNFLSQRTATDYPFIQHNAMCLETQHFPNSPNMKGVFQSPFIAPNKPYSHLSIFTIGVDK